MNTNYFKRWYKYLLLILIILTSNTFFLAGCNRYEMFIPEYHKLSEPPQAIDVKVLYNDYVTDSIAANSMYKGKKYLFSNIPIEKLSSTLTNPNQLQEDYVKYQSVKFRAQYPDYLEGYQEGFIVDVVGEVKGMTIGNILIIENCWFYLVEGSLVTIDGDGY